MCGNKRTAAPLPHYGELQKHGLNRLHPNEKYKTTDEEGAVSPTRWKRPQLPPESSSHEQPPCSNYLKP
jgi:hypothetical protein